MDVYERLESNVRSYCRSFPVEFDRASGATLFATDGRRFLDFFAGAGALNYGHDHPRLREPLLEYVSRGGIVHGLDMMTRAKRALLEVLESRVLAPRGLDYKVLFPGPTGTNAVEVALKIARRATGRATVVSFTNGFHGMTLGSLSVTGNRSKRAAAGVPLTHARMLPYDGYMGPDVDTVALLERLVDDGSSGLELPAAVIVETTQAEGGIHVSSVGWLARLAECCRRRGILFVVDDIQVGCGRTGPFFSFERAGVRPDVVCLSKSLSGYGLPMSLVLLDRGLDCLDPGEHNGTFRGFNLAFVTARAALETFWSDDALARATDESASRIRAALTTAARAFPDDEVEVRGIGMIQGIALPPGVARRVSTRAFELGLIVETAGPDDGVLKLLPPLTITRGELDEGLAILGRAIDDVTRGLGRGASHRAPSREGAEA